jgi:hypothetical protein
MLTDSFLISTNTAGTIEFSGYEDLTHKTDHSDNPQDMAVIYLQSLDATRQLQAFSDPGVDNITLTPTDILPKFVVSAVVTLNQMLQPITPNGYRYKVTTAGTLGSSEPTYPTTINGTVTSGTAVLTCISTKHAITEVTLALSSGALATNTPGGALSLGNTVLGGTSNKVAIYMRVINNVSIPSNNTTYPEIAIVINNVVELPI